MSHWLPPVFTRDRTHAHPPRGASGFRDTTHGSQLRVHPPVSPVPHAKSASSTSLHWSLAGMGSAWWMIVHSAMGNTGSTMVDDVITASTPANSATATKVPPPYVTAFHCCAEAAGRPVYVTPSGLVITRSPEAFEDTATNRPSPKVTENHSAASMPGRANHTSPSVLVMTRLVPVPPDAVAT